MKRKILIALLSLACAGCCAFGLAACNNGGAGNGDNQIENPDDPENKEPDFKFDESDDESKLAYELTEDGEAYVVTGIGDETGTDIVIPRTYKGLPVTAVGEYAFNGEKNPDLMSVRFEAPSNVETIAQYAFSACTSLLSVTIPDSVTTIETAAFTSCTGLLSVNLSSNLTTIGTGVFQSCTKLAQITIPDSVEIIGESAFQSCASLVSVSMGSGVNEISIRAFANCTALKTITLGSGVKTINDRVFDNCTNLETVVIPDSVQTVGEYVLYGCNKIKYITLPFIGEERYVEGETVSTSEMGVHDSWDEDNEELRYIDTHLGYLFGADKYERNRDYVPESLVTITITGDSALCKYTFHDVGPFGTGLQNVVLAGNLTAIHEYAFNVCRSIKTLVIPKSVKTIGDDILSGCDSISKIYYGGSQSDWSGMTVASFNSRLLGQSLSSSVTIPDVRCYYSETSPTGSGSYWHYVDGVITEW